MPGSSPGMTRKSAKISRQNPDIDRGEPVEIRYRGALVDLVRGTPDQPELDHGAIALDEARVGRPARGGECRLLPVQIGRRVRNEIDERSGLGQENVGVRGLEI